jgi:hypothetical protein
MAEVDSLRKNIAANEVEMITLKMRVNEGEGLL